MTRNIDALIADINKNLGEEAVYRGSAIQHQIIGRITSGSITIDWALGGGWPTNKWNEIIGDESSGKTAVALKTVAANQALDPEWIALWVASEEFVYEYAEMCGVDTDRVIVVDTNVMEDAYQAVVTALDSQAVDCVVIDSLPNLVPGEEDEKTMAEMQVGLGARITGKFFRKARKAGHRSAVTDHRPVTGLMINQWREKVGVMYGDNRTAPGGRAKNYSYFTRTEVRRDEWIEVDKVRVGQTIKTRAIKNKTAPPHRLGVVDFYFADTPEFPAGSYDTVKEILDIGMVLGVIKRRGAMYDLPNGESVKGRAGVAQAAEDEETRRLLTKHVTAALNGGEIIEPEPSSGSKKTAAKSSSGAKGGGGERRKVARRKR